MRNGYLLFGTYQIPIFSLSFHLDFLTYRNIPFSKSRTAPTNQRRQGGIPKEAPWKTLVLNEQSYKGLRIQYHYVWNGAKARLRWNTSLPQRPLFHFQVNKTITLLFIFDFHNHLLSTHDSEKSEPFYSLLLNSITANVFSSVSFRHTIYLSDCVMTYGCIQSPYTADFRYSARTCPTLKSSGRNSCAI